MSQFTSAHSVSTGPGHSSVDQNAQEDKSTTLDHQKPSEQGSDVLPADLRAKIDNVMGIMEHWSTNTDSKILVQPANDVNFPRAVARMPAGGVRMQLLRSKMANTTTAPKVASSHLRPAKRMIGPSISNVSSSSSNQSKSDDLLLSSSSDTGFMGQEVNAYIASARQMNRHYEDQRLKYQESVSSTPSDRIVHLPRGGIYLRTKCGAIQFGCPPETIKDSMKNSLPLPTYFVIPHDRFDKDQGISVAEFEFPAYFNFFIKRQKINLIIHRDAEATIRSIFQLTLLGPDKVEEPLRYSKAVPKEAYPDLIKEMSHFRVNPFDRTPLTVDTLLEFTYFDPTTREATITVDDKSVKIRDAGPVYQIWEDDQMTEIPSRVMLTQHHPFLVEHRKRMQEQRERQREDSSAAGSSTAPSSSTTQSAGESFDESNYFVPPHFGVTMLGVSDGFDPVNTATGMVIWMNRRGIMVDPPPHSPHLLQAYNIHPKLIRGVILTHCHADHDAGTFQKILEEGRVVLITTDVIKQCFIKKYAAISDFNTQFLETLFVFREAFVGEKLTVYGGELEFFYALHSIPCVGFSATCNGKSIIYSGDTMNDPATIYKLRDAGIMTEERCRKLVDFPWHAHDIILHEAGVPPIHTPISTLTNLPPEIRQKIRVVHTNPAKFPKDVGLQMCEPGPEHSIHISDEAAPNAFALEVLDLVGSLDWFSDLPISRAVEMVQSAKKLTFSKGQDVITQGGTDKLIYFMSMGIVGVYINGKFIRNMAVGDHFGEMALVNPGKTSERTATIRALTDVEVIAFEDSDFLHLVRGTKAIEKLQNLARHQKTKLWATLSANNTLGKLTSSQRNAFLSMATLTKVERGQAVWTKGEIVNCAVLIDSGQYFYYGGTPDEAREVCDKLVAADEAKDRSTGDADARTESTSLLGVQLFGTGVLVGEMNELSSPDEEHYAFTFMAKETGSVLKVSKTDFLSFCNENPGFIVSTMNRLFVE